MIQEVVGSRPEAFMHRAVAILALTSVLLHIMGGCCSHHAHAESPACCRESAQVASRYPCGAHHEHPPEPCRDEHHQGHRSRCEGGHCVFVVPESGTTVDLPAAGRFETAVAQGSSVFPQSSQAAICEFVARNTGLDPPVPPHLLNQVLLL